MRTLVAAAALSLISCGQCLGKGQDLEFLSWYNGWGLHTVWGAGTVSGAYKGAQVVCGRLVVPVRAIHDSHETDENPLQPEQTAEHAEAHNLEVLRSLDRQGAKCAFEQPPQLRPNNSSKPTPLRGAA